MTTSASTPGRDIAIGDRVTHPRYRGVVLWVVEPETELVPGWNEGDSWWWECDTCYGLGQHAPGCDDDTGTFQYIGPDYADPDNYDEVPTGRLVCQMVGDTCPIVFDPDELTLYDKPVCSCGQVGCGWHGQEDE